MLVLHQFSLESQTFSTLHAKLVQKITHMCYVLYPLEDVFSSKKRRVTSTQALSNHSNYWSVKCNILTPGSALETLERRLVNVRKITDMCYVLYPLEDVLAPKRGA